MDVVDHAALFLDRAVDWVSVGRDFLEPIAKLLIGFLKTLAMTDIVATDLTDDEAEGCGQDHPYGMKSAGFSVMRLAPRGSVRG